MGDTDVVRHLDTAPVELTRTRDRLTVSEVFGPTVQGEGPNTGRRCGFVRLGLCNLDCSWCDTAYTWDWTRYNRRAELHDVTFEELACQVDALGVRRLVISGGEPLVQGPRLTRFLEFLDGRYAIEIETNGTLDPTGLAFLVDHWNVSPKLAHSGVAMHKAQKPDVLRAFTRLPALSGFSTVAFKFVCKAKVDILEVRQLVERCDIDPASVWIMPEGTSAYNIVKGIERLADTTIANGFNLTSRLHVLAWGDTRGT
jgi:organic radical activating enzyme